jgi:hypothetical protein
MQEIDLFECFHNHPAKPRKEIDRKESSQAKQINERQSKRKKEMKEGIRGAHIEENKT